MADYIDDAGVVNELHQAVSLHNQLLQGEPERQPDFNVADGLHCVDCEVELHPVRIQMGRVRCVDCQEWLVHTEKMRAIRGRDE